MKIEITERGVYDQDGKRVPVGTEINIKGDDVPAWLANKCRVISQGKGKTAVTNPADDPLKEPAKAD